MTSPRPRLALDTAAPTSRASFRRIAKSIGATNREADTLRSALLARWVDAGGSFELERRLKALGDSGNEGDQGGTHDVDALLTVWFSSVHPVDGRLVAEDDPIVADLPEALRTQLTGTVVEAPTPAEASLDSDG